MRVHPAGNDIVAGDTVLTSQQHGWYGAEKDVAANHVPDARIGNDRSAADTCHTRYDGIHGARNTRDAISACDSDTGPGDAGPRSTA